MTKFSKSIVFLVLFIILFVAIRSMYFIYYVNWSGDQASFAIESLRIFQTKTLTLIGPQISANLGGHFIFQGPLIYYFFLLFLLLGKWDPVAASYLFMLFCALMIVPLYIGVKKLTTEKMAWIMVIIYSFVPYYINYTRFLWNSTLLFALLPILILLMGYFKERKTPCLFFLVSTWLGILLQFHYQFIIAIAGIFLYYFTKLKLPRFYVLLFVGGLALGFSPLILFELKHHFYNISTLILFLKNWNQVDRPGGISMPHYYISISFLIILSVLAQLAKQIKKIPTSYIVVAAIMLYGYALLLYIPRPLHAFWAPASPWNYLTEKKIYDTIRSTGITHDFNIANLAYYDTPAVVVKYFLKRDGFNINYDDYYTNKYLFVISEDSKYLTNPSYEIATFKPRKILQTWQINNTFNMFLLERM